jgi:glycosyltransferase involved in cell wall biosynthesis
MNRRIVVVSNDHVGSRMAGPGIRSYHFARELRSEGDVTLVVPFETDLEPDGFELIVANVWHAATVNRLIAGADCVVAQKLPVPTMRALARTNTRRIYDLYDPVPIEDLALDVGETTPRSPTMRQLNVVATTLALQTGDAFICASETQRNLWLGSLLQLGRVDQGLYKRDPSARELIDVVPFGIDPAPPRAEPVMKGVMPGIGPSDRVLLWPGGVWNWLDPLTVIDAVAELEHRRGDVRLVFLGLRHPNPHIPEMQMARAAVARADSLGLRDRTVFFNDGWVPYEQRGAYLLEADVGVSAHFDDLESRFSFRTRLLDCFWAGLPVVATTGDTLGDMVAARGLGRGVGVGDVQGWVEALADLLGDRQASDNARAAVAEIRDEYLWPRVVEPLRRLVRGTGEPLHRRAVAAAPHSWVTLRLRHALAEHGPAGAARRAAALLASGIAAGRYPRRP